MMIRKNSGWEKGGFMGLGSRLVLWFVFFAILPVVVTGIAGHVMLMAHMDAQIEKLLAGVVTSKKYDVEHSFEDIRRSLNSLARRSVTLAMMEAVSGKKSLSRSEFSNLRNEFEKNILSQHLGVEDYRNVLLLGVDGVVRYSKNTGIRWERVLADEGYVESSLAAAVKTSLHSMETVFADDGKIGFPGMFSMYAVKALQNRIGEVSGILVVQYDDEKLGQPLENYVGLGRTFALHLEGPQGRLNRGSGAWEPAMLAPTGVNRGLFGDWDKGSGADSRPMLRRFAGSDGTVRLRVESALAVRGLNYRLVAEIHEKEAFALKDRIGLALLLLSGVLVAVMTGGAVMISGRISRPINEMREWAEAVADGDLSLREISCPYDDMRRYVRSFSAVVAFLNETAKLAADVSSGDYSNDIALRSPHDELGASLRRMTESLRDASSAMASLATGDFYARVTVKGPNDLFSKSLNSMVEKIRATHEQGRVQARQKTLQAELNEIMRGDKALEELCRKILSFYCLCFKAALGTFYVREEDGESLRLYGGFALSSHRSFPCLVRAGEGLAGQAFQEKRMILLPHCPETYLNARTLVCSMKTASVLVYPFVRDGRVEALVELGSPGRFSARDLDLLELVSESVAIAIASAVNRLKMTELLDKTVKQSDDLRMKQEELNAINRDLKEQTAKLLVSEKQLRLKEDEMARINAALEERSLGLQQQKEEIREKNMALEAAQAELIEKTESLESGSRHKSEFLANMSHELRTPLNSILLISRLLEENRLGNLTEKQIEFTRTIHSAGVDLLSLIDDILDLSRIEAGKLELIRIKARIGDITGKIHLHFDNVCREKGIELRSEIHEAVPENVFVDLKRIDQILKNLVSNAVKFTSSGAVTVSFSMPAVCPQGIMPITNMGNALQIAVHDTGQGIPVDKHELVFEPFRQADDSIGKTFGGTGLGLSISRKLARLMGGDITLESRVGEGSTFTFFVPDVFREHESPDPDHRLYFPMPMEETMADEESGADEIDELKGRRILIVDDDMRHVYALMHCLENRGPELVVAKTGEDCLNVLNGKEPVDLVIMDVMMKDMSGFKAMRQIRDDARFKDLPVISVTARAMKGDREKCLDSGASAYVSKPVDMDLLMKIMKDLLSRTPENEIKERK